MEYPALVYCTPGPHVGKGFKWDSASVVSLDDHIEALDSGNWFYSLDEARDKTSQADRVKAMRAERKVIRDAETADKAAALEKLQKEVAADEQAAQDAELARMQAEEDAAKSKDTITLKKK